MSAKFWSISIATFVLLLLAWVLVTFGQQVDLWTCVKKIWGPVILITLALGIIVMICNGWDTITLNDSILSILLGSVASFLVALAYQGAVILLK